ncbi:MAG TPA: ABC transporter substrate-binding protein [Novosphingobium sp.]|nr:ABC transporter substrate-binding protein [Novosphingobium sp.]
MAFSARLLIAALLSLGLLAACGRDADRPVEIAVIGDAGALAQGGKTLPYAARLVRSATTEGLVGFDEQGRVIPALADRWIVTDDGQSYIFRLRDGTWLDGSPITGESARTALLAALAGLKGSPLALDLAPIGEVRTMAGRVVELRLSRAEPDLLQLLAQPELGLARKGRGAGPMLARRDTGVVRLEPIAPTERGLPDVEGWAGLARRLNLRSMDGASAIERFGTGETDAVLSGRIEDFPRIDIAGLSRGAIRFDPVMGLFGLQVLHADGFLAKPENREALAMAIDRDALISAFGLSGWVASTRVVSPGTEGDSGQVNERWIGQDMAERRLVAAARVAQWRAGGKVPEALRIALPRGPGADLLFARLSEDFKAVGLATVRVKAGTKADLRLVDTAARYARAGWFLNQLSCTIAQGLCSSLADRRFFEARAETDPVKRADLMADAEAELTKANIFIPFGAPLRWSLVSGSVTGFAVNRFGVHPLMPLAMRPK